ncbi:MAG: GguC family protein [Gemmatimonadota bacterium]|nr:GguC family protein [Gemmatimonadota bacterium]
MFSLIQLIHPEAGRRIAAVDGDRCRLIDGHTSIHGVASFVLRSDTSLAAEIESSLGRNYQDYDAIYHGRSEWRLLPAYDHPGEPSRCLVAGTGLTHRASVDNRQAMHEQDGGGETQVTDSMRIYEWGLQGGRPEPGNVGVSPEWFYKGTGSILRAHGESLVVPAFAGDGGEEPEVAGAYIIDSEGNPRRIGFATGNEFSDHVTEKKNYLYLAPSKLRTCAIGPELLLDPDFENVGGDVSIERNGNVVWSRTIATGEANMSHSLANLEHHHFKYLPHRRPDDAHVFFFGADAFSFGAGVELEDGDVMAISWNGFGRPLKNPLRIEPDEETLVRVEPL